MATKNMTKTNTKPKTTQIVEDNVDVVKVVETKTKTITDNKKKFNDDDLIPCRSITNGKLVMEGRSGNVYRWQNYGDTEYVSYKDLRASAQNTNANSYVFTPCFIIEDNDFISEFKKVEEFYNSMYTTGDLEEILELSPAQITKVIEELPKGCRDSLKSLASDMIRDGRLDSIKRVKALDEVFGTKLLLTMSEDY